MDAAAVARTLRPRLTDALIALDFDGTLAPIVADPERSRPVDGTVQALTALTEAGVRVAVITGRDAATAVRLGGLDAVPGIRVVGLYGAETWHDGHLDAPPTPPQIETLRSELPAVLQDAAEGTWIEDKRLSLVVHTRRTDDPAGHRDALAPIVEGLGTRLGFDVELGNGVIEFRLPGYDKGAVLRALAEPVCRGADGIWRGAVLYAGDDLGDLPAFRQVQRLRGFGVGALALGVRASGVAEVLEQADATVADPAEVVALLRGLLE